MRQADIFAYGFPTGSMRCARVTRAGTGAREFPMNGICALWQACRWHRRKRSAFGPGRRGAQKIYVFCEHSARVGCLLLRRNGPWGVPDSHATLRRSWTRFDSWRGHFSVRSPRVCRAHGGIRSRRAGFDSRAGDLIRIMSLGCDGFAYDSAKVVDQVRFLARTSLFDAGARRPGDRLQPGSSGFDSHRRLCELRSAKGQGLGVRPSQAPSSDVG